MDSKRDKPLVLVADDTHATTIMLQRLFEYEGYRVHCAYNGPDALDAARELHPDLVLLDINMPGMNGFEVLQRMRESESTASIPTILITALGDQSAIVQGLQLGADDYVTKPFSPRELVARVRAVLRRLESPRGATMQVLTAGTLRLDPTYRTVTLDDALIDLTTIEFNLLHYLMLLLELRSLLV